MRKEVEIKIVNAPENQIDLRYMNIKDDEIREIVELIITKKPNANKIFLDNNFIGDVGATILAEKLRLLSNLHFLDLQYNQIDRTGISAILNLKVHNKHLTPALHGNRINHPLDISKLENSIIENRKSPKN